MSESRADRRAASHFHAWAFSFHCGTEELCPRTMDLVNRVRYFATSRQLFRRNASAAVDEVATNFVALVQQLDQWNEGLLADLSRAVKVTEEPSMLANRILQAVEAVLREKRPFAAVFARCYSVSVSAARLELSLLSELSEDYPWGKTATLLDTVIALGILAKLAPTFIDLLGFNDTDSKDGTLANSLLTTQPVLIPSASLLAFLQRTRTA